MHYYESNLFEKRDNTQLNPHSLRNFRTTNWVLFKSDKLLFIVPRIKVIVKTVVILLLEPLTLNFTT